MIVSGVFIERFYRCLGNCIVVTLALMEVLPMLSFSMIYSFITSMSIVGAVEVV